MSKETVVISKEEYHDLVRKGGKDVVIETPTLTVNRMTGSVIVRGVLNEFTTRLTRRECDLLCYLIEQKGRAIDRDELALEVWTDKVDSQMTNVIDVYINYLRNKLDKPSGIQMVHTVRGVGYRFADAGIVGEQAAGVNNEKADSIGSGL